MRLLLSFIIILVCGFIIKSKEYEQLAEIRKNKAMLGHTLNETGRYMEKVKPEKKEYENFPWQGWSLVGLYNIIQGQAKW